MQVVSRAMDDMVMKFADAMALTIEEQRVMVIDELESALLRAKKMFLVGRVLTRKAFNKERFKRQMVNLWRPKTRVTIVELEDGLFRLVLTVDGRGRCCRKEGRGYKMVLCWLWRRQITGGASG